MTYVSAPFWWLVCDEPGCGVKSTEDSDYAAWGDKSQAVSDAIDSEWSATDKEDLHFCPKHSNRVCLECGRHVPVGVSRDRDGMCEKCWAEDTESDHGAVQP